MTSDMPAPLQTIRVIGRTLSESMAWGSVFDGLGGSGAVLVGGIVLGSKALGRVTGKLFARSVFKIHEVKFRKGDVIRVKVWSSWLLPCDVAVTTGSRQPQGARRVPKRKTRRRKAGRPSCAVTAKGASCRCGFRQWRLTHKPHFQKSRPGGGPDCRESES